MWVMEPLRGGKLAKLLPEYEAGVKELRPDEKRPQACLMCRSCEQYKGGCEMMSPSRLMQYMIPFS